MASRFDKATLQRFKQYTERHLEELAAEGDAEKRKANVRLSAELVAQSDSIDEHIKERDKVDGQPPKERAPRTTGKDKGGASAPKTEK